MQLSCLLYFIHNFNLFVQRKMRNMVGMMILYVSLANAQFQFRKLSSSEVEEVDFGEPPKYGEIDFGEVHDKYATLGRDGLPRAPEPGAERQKAADKLRERLEKQKRAQEEEEENFTQPKAP